MRRAWIAAAALALLAAVPSLPGCGGDPRQHEPSLKLALRDLAKAVVVNDKATIQGMILPDAGMRNSPLAAKDADTPEGRENLYEGNRKWIRACFRDAGIKEEKDIETFMNALHINLQGKNAWVTFEIAAEGRRVAEVVNFRMTLSDKGWKMFDYSRLMKGMR